MHIFYTNAYAVHREWGGADLSGAKKFGVILIVATCATIGVAIFSRLYAGRTLPEHDPGLTDIQEHAVEKSETGNGEIVELVLGEEVFLSAVEEMLQGQLGISGLSAQIQENAVVVLSGTVNKSEAAAQLEKQTDSISSAYLSVLDLLPDSLPLQLELGMRANNGAIEVSLKSLKVSSMEIPESVIGTDALDLLENHINRHVSGKFSEIESVTSVDGTLTVTGKSA